MQKFLAAELANDMVDKRTKLDIGIRDAAKQVGISAMLFQNIEDKKAFKIDNVLKVCAWLGKDIRDFFTPIKKKAK